MRKKFLAIILVVILITGLWAVPTGLCQEKIKSDLVLVGGGTTGTYYIMCAAIGALLTDKLDYIKSGIAQVTAASAENIKLLETGKADFGLASAAKISDAMLGQPPFKKKYENLRSICWAHGSLLHMIVGADSNIYSVYDLKGKKVRFDNPGSGFYSTFNRVLATYSLTKDDVRAFIGADIDAFKEGMLDAFPVGFRPSSPDNLLNIMSKRSIRIISLEPEMIGKFLKKYPGYRKAIIPAGTYPGIDYDVTTISFPACFITHKDEPEELVYQATKLVAENIDYLALSNINFKQYVFNPDVTEATFCPLHPGAEKYYREIGLLK